jgi:hypothetical protein
MDRICMAMSSCAQNRALKRYFGYFVEVQNVERQNAEIQIIVIQIVHMSSDCWHYITNVL